jgi:hypothetical protein
MNSRAVMPRRNSVTNSRPPPAWTTRSRPEPDHAESAPRMPVASFCRKHHIRRLALFGSVLPIFLLLYALA